LKRHPVSANSFTSIFGTVQLDSLIIVNPLTRYSCRRSVAYWRNYVPRWERTR